jgi:histidine triad (HIT) family protein
MADCIFCDILSGQGPASFVYRDELVNVFMDIQPVNPGHLLVVPNTHYASLAELDPAVGCRLFQTGQRLAKALYASGLHCEAVNLLLADGPAAGQDVFHVHLHVLPRFKKDGFGFKFSQAYFKQRPSREMLDEIAAQIRTADRP